MGDEALWPRRPPPMQGESFSSWFARLALANAVTPSELFRIALPGARLFRADLDRTRPKELVETLCRRTDVPETLVQRMTFLRWSDSLAGDDDDERTGKLVWLPPAGTAHSKKSFGLQYCPACLEADPTPYFRIDWRISYRTVCTVHQASLHDRCPSCQAPIQPLNISTARAVVVDCWQCGFDLRSSALRLVDPCDIGIEAQGRFDRAVMDGWGDLGPYGYQHAVPYFQIAWRVYRSLATGQFALPLRCEALELLASKDPPNNAPAPKEVERLPPRARRWLLGLTDTLMRDWPERYIAACRSVGMAARHIVKERSQTPFALLDPVLRDLSAAPRTVSAEEFEQAKAFLRRKGLEANRSDLEALLGCRLHCHTQAIDPAQGHAPYGAGRYWKLDGVSPEIRERAKRAARRDGEKIGPWVEQALREILKTRTHNHNM